MPLREPSGPDLSGVIADANAAGLEFVVIGGFSVIYHGYIRATKDSDLLVPDGPASNAAVKRFLDHAEGRRLHDEKVLTVEDIAAAENLRIDSRHGIVDLMHGGLPPLDYATVSASALEFDVGGQPARVASLSSVVGFKRLAGRPQDKTDLHELEALYGELPLEHIPGLDP
jgi:hypothetical protein